MRGAYALRCQHLISCLLLTVTAPVAAQPGFGEPSLEHWGMYQRNLDGTSKWTYWPRLYVPYQLGNGVTFTQRIDVPMSTTNASGPGNPTGTYSGGLGDAFIEEIFETPELRKTCACMPACASCSRPASKPPSVRANTNGHLPPA